MRIDELNIVSATQAKAATEAAIAATNERNGMSPLMASMMNRVKAAIKEGKSSFLANGVNARFDADEWARQMTALGYIVTDLSGKDGHVSRSFQVRW